MSKPNSTQEFIKMGVDGYMKDRVDNQLKWMSGKSKTNKNYYQRFKLMVIILSVSIPFFVSFVKEFPYFTYVVGAAGVFIAAFEGVLSLYDYQNNWLNYRGTIEALKREKFLFATSTGAYKEAEDSFAFFVERAEAILDSENKNWAKFSSDAPSIPKQKKA